MFPFLKNPHDLKDPQDSSYYENCLSDFNSFISADLHPSERLFLIFLVTVIFGVFPHIFTEDYDNLKVLLSSSGS